MDLKTMTKASIFSERNQMTSMKIRDEFLATVLLTATVCTSCSTDDLTALMSMETKTVSLAATLNGTQTRAGMNKGTGGNTASFYWHNKDAILVQAESYNDIYQGVRFSTTDETGSTNVTFQGDVPSGATLGKYAVYPYNEKHSFTGATTLTYNLPNEYTYTTVDNGIFSKTADNVTTYRANSTNIPMYGVIADGNVVFQYIGGLAVIRIDQMPYTSGTLTVSADQKLSGDYTVDLSTDNPELTTTSPATDSEKQVVFTFSGATDGGVGVFYLPLATGEYTNLSIKMSDSNGERTQTILYGTLNILCGNAQAILLTTQGGQLSAKNAFTSFTLKTKGNSPSVLKDVTATVSGNEIKFSSPYITDVAHLRPSFVTNGTVYVDDTTQKSGASEQNFTSPVTYKVVYANGEESSYIVTVKYSGLPVMEITTPNGAAITSKEDWMKNAEYKIIKTDGTIDCSGTLSIKGRGNSTWTYPKKPYAIKLDSKAKVLGLPKEKRFDLLANWMDRTLLRNDVTYHIANLTNTMGWNPTGKFVEVVLNGKHIGNYYLCEHIKVSENRVNITELDENATSGDALTGGYIMELDVYYDEAYKFKSAKKSLPYMFKDPDEVNDAQFSYMRQYVSDLETALYDETKFASREFTNYMDIDSYVDWWFVYELAGNAEPNWPKSCYVHKDKNGKMIAGPVWDFDWGTYQYGSSWKVNNCMYYGQLFKDATFKARVKEKWNAQKVLYEAVDTYIATQAEYLKHSDELNFALWPISQRVNGDETMSFADAIKRMRDNYKNRIVWMNTQINAF